MTSVLPSVGVLRAYRLELTGQTARTGLGEVIRLASIAAIDEALARLDAVDVEQQAANVVELLRGAERLGYGRLD